MNQHDVGQHQYQLLGKEARRHAFKAGDVSQREAETDQTRIDGELQVDLHAGIAVSVTLYEVAKLRAENR